MRRDEHGIIIQTNEDPSYQDGGDSAFSTGLMAFAGSQIDKRLMVKFILNGKLVRHPFQSELGWDDSKKTSRDQIIAFFSGMLSIGSVDMPLSEYLILEQACIDYANGCWANSDFLLPDVRLYLYKCARQEPPIDLKIIGTMFAAISLFWDCFIRPNQEKNQSVCKNIAFGKNWIRFLVKHHPGLERNITEYFSGVPFRNKAEIGFALNNKIAESI